MIPEIAKDLTVTEGSLIFTTDIDYKKIEVNVFNKYTNKANVNTIMIPESVKLIEPLAFLYFTKLETLILNEKLQIISEAAFSSCSSLKNVTIPKNVHYLDSFAFSNCTALKTIKVAEDNTYYYSQDGVVYNKDKTELVIHPIANTNYNIPKTVTRIGNNAFEKNTMKDVTLPDSVTYIGKSAFGNCQTLATIIIPSSVKVIDNWAFTYCYELENITYNGTKADWNKIQLRLDWNEGCKEITVTCTAEPGNNKTITIDAYKVG